MFSPLEATQDGEICQTFAVMQPLLTTEQVALRLNVHEETVRRYVRSGELPAIRKGRLIRIAPAAVEEFLRPAETKSSWARAAKLMAPIYADSIKNGGALTAFSVEGGDYVPSAPESTPEGGAE